MIKNASLVAILLAVLVSWNTAAPTSKTTTTFTQQLGNRFLLDPNEINSIGLLGPYDNTHSQDAGNVGTATLARTTGGFEYPFDVKLTRFRMWHSNSNDNAEAWGWVIAKVQKVDDSFTALATTYILDEVAVNGGVGPRDYGDNQTILTDIEIPDTPDAVIPAGTMITMGVSAPTANGTNYYVNCHGGYFFFERLDVNLPPRILSVPKKEKK